MDLEQKKLLYEIVKWHNINFYNQMEDHWTSKNRMLDSECDHAIRKLESEYKEKYGDLPEWQYINDVWALKNKLEEELCV